MSLRRSPTPTYFTSLRLDNVRCFGQDTSLRLTDRQGLPAQWTLILGDNGVGKTTLLQCLAWMRPVPAGDSGVEVQTDVSHFAGPPPLTKGVLAPAILREENVVFDSLCRIDTQSTVKLRATLSVGARLAADPSGRSRDDVPWASIRTGVDLTFKTGRLDEDRVTPRPSIARTLGGAFYEPLIVAYGANRQLGTQNLANRDLDDPIASRLAGRTELYDVEELLTALDYAAARALAAGKSESREHRELDRFRGALARILPEAFTADDIQIFPPDVLSSGRPSGVQLDTFSGLVPLSKLSLGYQTTLSWTADLAWRLSKHYPRSENPLGEPAIVMIDEIDLHLHPLWQVRILGSLTALFPRTQFIATAHSPLMVQVAETANLVLLRKREGDVEVVSNPHVVRTWRVDQILASELFDVPSTRNPSTEHLFARRAELLAKSTLSRFEHRELDGIRSEIAALPTEERPEDQQAIELIRRAAAVIQKHRLAPA
ncbi:hypothetical protein tb265_49950 [Gemmatimonadetes bacterium T265]|nr:hypothetical protein tb265_49950 [Gemmatimonadetes bacterium T265]